MRNLIIRLVKAINNRRRMKRVNLGFVDHDAFLPVIEKYRARGARIGKKVRLLGHLDGVNPHLVSIGDCSVIGVHSALLTHCPIKGGLPCVIGNYVYLAFNVIVLPGIKIGDHSIIGAGSVVTKDIPPGSIVAGNPARVIRAITDEEKLCLIDAMDNDRIFGWTPRGP